MVKNIGGKKQEKLNQGNKSKKRRCKRYLNNCKDIYSITW